MAHRRHRGSRSGSLPAAGPGAETSVSSRSELTRGGAQGPAAEYRGRPGRRTSEDRTHAVLALLGGKATVDQLAARYGVQASTVEGWRQLAVEALAAAMRQGTARSARELQLEREMGTLRDAFTDLAIKHERVERALRERPFRPERSPR